MAIGEDVARVATGRFARPEAAAEAPDPALAAEARALIDEPGPHLAWREDDGVHVLPLQDEWTRVGRSLAADVRFEDASVSRRHALLVRVPDGVRVIDDRSLNGVFVNGERVDWKLLHDGDEVLVGRFALTFLDG